MSCSAEIPLSNASPNQLWKVSICALIPVQLRSCCGHVPGFCGWQGGEGSICVLFRKSIHYAPPIKKPDDGVNALPGLLSSTICRPDKMRMYRHQAKHYSPCVMIAGMVSSLRNVRISQPFSVTTIVCSYCADKLRSLVFTVQPSFMVRMR